MTVEEAAVYLRIGRARAYASITAGEIPVRRFGRVIRVYLKDLDEGRPGTPAKRPGLSVVR